MALGEMARPRRREVIDVVDMAANGTNSRGFSRTQDYKTEAESVEALRAVDLNVRRSEFLGVEEGCP